MCRTTKHKNKQCSPCPIVVIVTRQNSRHLPPPFPSHLTPTPPRLCVLVIFTNEESQNTLNTPNICVLIISLLLVFNLKYSIYLAKSSTTKLLLSYSYSQFP